MKDMALFGIVPTSAEAEDLVAELLAEGFAAGDISVLLPSDAQPQRVAIRLVADGILGVLGGLGGFSISGLGPIVAAGPIVPIFAAVGSAAAGFIRLGLSEKRALEYETDLQRGNVLVSVHSDDSRQVDAAKLIFISNRLRHLGGGSKPASRTSN